MRTNLVELVNFFVDPTNNGSKNLFLQLEYYWLSKVKLFVYDILSFHTLNNDLSVIKYEYESRVKLKVFLLCFENWLIC